MSKSFHYPDVFLHEISENLLIEFLPKLDIYKSSKNIPYLISIDLALTRIKQDLMPLTYANLFEVYFFPIPFPRSFNEVILQNHQIEEFLDLNKVVNLSFEDYVSTNKNKFQEYKIGRDLNEKLS